MAAGEHEHSPSHFPSPGHGDVPATLTAACVDTPLLSAGSGETQVTQAEARGPRLQHQQAPHRGAPPIVRRGAPEMERQTARSPRPLGL